MRVAEKMLTASPLPMPNWMRPLAIARTWSLNSTAVMVLHEPSASLFCASGAFSALFAKRVVSSE